MDSTNEQNTQESQEQSSRPNYYLPSNSSKSKRSRSKHHRHHRSHRSLKSRLGVGGSSHRRHRHHHHHHHRSHRVRNTVLVLLLVLIVAAGVCGGALYLSARNVLAHARSVSGEVKTLQKGFLEGDGSALKSSSTAIAADADAINDELQGMQWQVASHLPFVGQDVRNIQTLGSSASVLGHDVLEPLAEETAGFELRQLLQNKVVNTGLIKQLRGSVVSVSPTFVQEARTIAELPNGHIDQLNEVLDGLREPLSTAADVLDDADGMFDAVLDMLGDGGKTRHYVILAQQNSEIRAVGGYPGAVSTATVTDGKVELNEFSGVLDIMQRCKDGNFGSKITDDELQAFGDVLSKDPAGSTLTPNYVRAGEISREQWEFAYGEKVDGVIAADPLFVQRVLGVVGAIEAEDGTVVDGENAGYEIMINSYWRYADAKTGEYNEDDFFHDVADRAFHKLIDSMGDVDFLKLADAFLSSGRDHRFLVWLADSAGEELMSKAGFSGELSHDATQPVLGIYANDNTWAKLTWYMDITTEFGEPTANADGTTSYPVTAHFINNYKESDVDAAFDYIQGVNPLCRQKCDLIETIYVMAPEGGTVTDYEVHQDAPIEKENQLQDERLKVYGFDTMRSRIQILPGGDTYVTFTVTLPAEAQGKLPEVRTSPLCHD